MKKMLKKINFADFVIVIGILAAIAVGFTTVKQYRQTADKQIEAISDITFEVFLRGVTVTGSEFPIKSNDKTFLTIRNVPYTELNVLTVTSKPRQTAVASSKAIEQYILIKDPAQPSIYDAIIKIGDTAKITRDGAVVGGNKIKMGLPVTLEGKNYKFNGTISDVKVSSGTDVKNAGENDELG